MKIIYLLILCSIITYSQVVQEEDIVGYHFKNGQIILNAGKKLRNNNSENIGKINKQEFVNKNNTRYAIDSNNSFVRYSVHDRYAIGNYCDLTGNGLFSFVGWGLNYQRAACYNNVDVSPVWKFKLPHNHNIGYGSLVSCSSSGEYVAVSDVDSYFYLLNGINGAMLWKYTTIPSTFQIGRCVITNSGDFIIGSLNYRNPNVAMSSILLGFNKNSNVPIWQTEIPLDSTVLLNFQHISGIRISGNDSLAIVSNYFKFFVIKVSTGQIIYSNWNNPYNHEDYGSGPYQGINGDGSILAIPNYWGYVRVYQWNGNTYEYLWEDQEPPGEYWNWIQCVDISYDGSMIAAGALTDYDPNLLDFKTGKVKFYKTYSGNNPVWTHTDSSDGVNDVSFSKNGKILCAVTGGKYANPSLPNLLVFKTTANVNIPIFAVSDSGSFYDCSVSDDGTTVIGGGERNHVGHYGMGGMYYNLFIDTSAEPIGIISNEKNVPDKFYLSQNYPNPFNPKTIINYQLPMSNYVKLTIYDAIGRETAVLVNQKQNAGSYSVEWDGTNYSSGLYFYKLECEGFTDVKKMALIK
jgi:hypothetical protein